MKKEEINKLQVCRLNVEFLMYTSMINNIFHLLKDDSELLMKKLKKDLIDLKSIEEALKNALNLCSKQIYFVDSILNGHGIDYDPYDA